VFGQGFATNRVALGSERIFIVQLLQKKRSIIFLEQRVLDAESVDVSRLTLFLSQHFSICGLAFLLAHTWHKLERTLAILTDRMHRLVCLRWRTLFIPFLKDLRKTGFAICLSDLNRWLFNAEKILAAIFDCVWSTLKTLNFRDMAIFPPSAAILVVMDVLVWVLWLYHLFLVVVFK